MYKEDYYKVLEIPRNASQDEIQMAYRRLVKEHHPDKKGGDSVRIKEINEAYETLKNPNKRLRYDLLNPVEEEETEINLEGLEESATYEPISQEAIRIGFGFDVHPLVSYKKLFLGGIEISHAYGLAAHSDGDVVLHALCDALLGAIGEDDIGHHFPDTNPEYKDASSVLLLQQVAEILQKRGYRPSNVDIVILAEKPKLAPYFPKMKEKISKILEIGEDRIGVKATTNQGLGYIGKKEGLAAYAIATVLPTRRI
jgi:2-C-methyl-D-erythritol 2,4-cyclodiphosphate synthase